MKKQLLLLAALAFTSVVGWADETDDLNKTIALAEQEGANVDAIKNSDKSVGDKLRFVRNARKINANKVDISSVVPSEVPATGDGDFYIYNVGTGLFFDCTADWGTHISVDKPGMLVHFRRDGEWGGLPVFHLSGRGWNGMNWNEEYWDKNGENKLAFVPVEGKDKVYSFCEWDNYNWHFWYDVFDDACDGNTHYWNSIQKTDQNVEAHKATENAQWMLISKEAYIAAMANASEENPLDVTFLIKNPDFSKVSGDRWTDGWTNPGAVCTSNDRHQFCVLEWFERDINMSQRITNLPMGKYRVSCHAFYRDGSSDNEAAKVGKGEQLIQNAFLFANDKEVALPNVTSEAGNMPGVGDTRTGVDGAFANWPWQANEYFQTGLYKVSTDIVEVGADGILTIGLKSTYNKILGSWVVADNFRLEYLGELEDVLGPALSSLNSAIEAAQAIDQDKLTEAAKTALNNAVANAQGYTESTDVEAIAEACQALINVIQNVENMDIATLQASVEYAEGRGYTDAQAADALANALKASDVNDAVNGLKVRFKQHVADKSAQPTQFTKVTEAVLGEQDNERTFEENDLAKGLYIYNVGTGRWFCGGDKWGAHAAIGFPGIKVTLPADNYGEGHYNSIITHLYNGDWGNGGRLNHEGYCDTGGNGWKFYNVDATQGIVTIARNGSNTGDQSGNGFGTKALLGFSDNTLMRVDTDKQGAENPNNQWIFVTEAQRDAMAVEAMEEASAENPVDLTWKIGMPGFNQRERLEGTNQGAGEKLAWTCNHANYRYNAQDNGSRHAICERGNDHADFCIDIYGGQWNDAFSWKQTISGLTPGKYRVKVQGYNNRGTEENQAQLVANDQSTVLRNADTEDVLPWVGRLADNTWEAVEYFENGCYWNEVVCSVTADGTLTIGVEAAKMEGDHVVLFDNFRLEYIGKETATAIVNANASANANQVIYNLAGQRLSKTVKGINIVNGQKILK